MFLSLRKGKHIKSLAGYSGKQSQVITTILFLVISAITCRASEPDKPDEICCFRSALMDPFEIPTLLLLFYYVPHFITVHYRIQ